MTLRKGQILLISLSKQAMPRPRRDGESIALKGSVCKPLTTRASGSTDATGVLKHIGFRYSSSWESEGTKRCQTHVVLEKNHG